MNDLTQEEAKALFGRIVKGEMNDAELSTLLIALKKKGETPAEIAGAATAFLEAAAPFPCPDYEFADCVGTGGDGLGTLNVSTAVMFVAAEMGLRMAKHGNVAVSSKCGSADVLKTAGVKLDMSPRAARRCLDEIGLTFLYAPQYHAGMRHAAQVRKTLGVRTILNILGPLINPSRPHIQLSGVYSPALVRPYAETLLRLGVQKGLVVHGSGLDEIALHGPTVACLIKDGVLQDLTLSPKDAGIPSVSLDQVIGGDADYNRNALIGLLSGRGSDAYIALVAINAGALFWVAGRSNTFKEGVSVALATIKSGRCILRLQKLAEMSHYD